MTPTRVPWARYRAHVEQHDVVIVGAGIAGLACALEATQSGARCLLLEASPRLGGRASSFKPPGEHELIDNCQHISLGCCTNYIRFLEEIGSDHLIDWHRDFHFVERGVWSSIRLSDAASPFHFAGDRFTNARSIRFLSRAACARIAALGLVTIRTNKFWHHSISALHWLRENLQQAEEIERLWEPICVSACNTSLANTAASAFIHVLQEGAITNRDAAAMGIPNCPLNVLYEPAADILEAAGSSIRMVAKVVKCERDRVVLSTGQSIRADSVVITVPWHRVNALLDHTVRLSDSRFTEIDQIKASPIIGGHLEFSDEVLPVHAASFVGATTQWVFRREGSARRLHSVVSGADAMLRTPNTDIANHMESECREWLEIADHIELRSARIVKEPFATIAVEPGVPQRRPQTIGDSGIVLAGCYTDTGWPSTMEGAVRSGLKAADAVVGRPIGSSIQASLPIEMIPKLLGNFQS